MKRKLAVRFAVICCLLFASSNAFALAVGQSDTFEDGTTQNWVVALLGFTHPTPPANVSSGGPAGIDDNFLQLASIGGQSAGSRLTAINGSQWAGNYIAAGIGAISMDVINLGATDIELRLLFSDPVAGPPANLAFSKDSIHLLAGGGWTSVVFPITPLDLIAGSGTVENALMNATELRLFHGSAPGFPGEPVLAQVGVDNITALQGRISNDVPDIFGTGVAAAVLFFGMIGAHGFRRPSSALLSR